MKIISSILLMLFCFLPTWGQSSGDLTIDLSTARNSDGSVMPIGAIDPNWSYNAADGVWYNATVKGVRIGWSIPLIDEKKDNEWIMWDKVHAYNGTRHFFKSKVFEINTNYTGKLNYRALAYMRHWTYLVKINNDGTETQTLISKTEQMDPTRWIGWFNSWNPVLKDYSIPPGKYYLKVDVSGEGSDAYTVSLAVCSYIKVTQGSTNPDDMRGPNSYIFDINNKGVGGLNIPVAKAYAMWKENKYLNQSIPSGKLSASVYWEDVEGLIKSAQISQGATDDASKIRVMVNKARGKGNAVIAFHVGANGNSTDPVYWSWHVWVTDDPSNGASYSTGYDFNLDKLKFTPQFMDRNLGATNNSFLGNDWNKSGGLIYQWGRKDPLPPLAYKDFTFYKVSGSFAKDPMDYGQFRTSGFTPRMATIEENIKYSVNNPLKYIKAPSGQNWFTNQPKVDTNTSFDLWGDTNEGKVGAQWVDEPYKLKSPFDPCPHGWRIPSFEGNQAINSVSSPWGRQSGWQDGGDNINEVSGNTYWSGIKIYPSLGIDFRGVANRNLGLYANTGKVQNTSTDKVTFQDESSESFIWSATAHGNGANGRVFHIINSSSPSLPKNRFEVYTHGFYDISGAAAIRCIKDPNVSKLKDFKTEYIPAVDIEYTEGLNNPNSYIIKKDQTILKIPVNKAYAVYNQLLTDHEWPIGQQSANVYWTTDQNLIKSVTMEGEGENANIVVTFNPNKPLANAVISLHLGQTKTSSDPVFWSWLLWATDGDPEQNTITYITEPIVPTGSHIVNLTKSGHAPLVTTFMDRNLGALYPLPSSMEADSFQIKAERSGGLHYQWGRKDPLPVFRKVGWAGNFYDIYLGTTDATGKISYSWLNYFYYSESGRAIHAKEFNEYSKVAGVNAEDKMYKNNQKVIKYSIANPLTYLYNNSANGGKDWLTNVKNEATDRWGHASKKSVYDPCPQGWRVPDQMNAYVSRPENKDFGGSSPWYNGYYKNAQGESMIQGETGYKVTTDFGATELNNSYIVGYVFNSPNYSIGNYPINLMRGFNGNGSLTTFSERRTGVWSAAMANDGSAFATEIAGPAIRIAAPRNAEIAMDIRCVKDEPRYTGELIVPKTTRSTPSVPRSNRSIEQKIDENNVLIVPNPTNGLFKVAIHDLSDGHIQVYDLHGKIILSRSFNRSSGNEIEVNIQNHPTGLYLVRIESNNHIFYKKVLKE